MTEVLGKFKLVNLLYNCRFFIKLPLPFLSESLRSNLSRNQQKIGRQERLLEMRNQELEEKAEALKQLKAQKVIDSKNLLMWCCLYSTVTGKKRYLFSSTQIAPSTIKSSILKFKSFANKTMIQNYQVWNVYEPLIKELSNNPHPLDQGYRFPSGVKPFGWGVKGPYIDHTWCDDGTSQRFFLPYFNMNYASSKLERFVVAYW